MKLLTTKQVANRLNVSDSRVRQLILSGRLPANKLGNSWTIKEDDLKLVADRKTGRPAKSKIINKDNIQDEWNDHQERWDKRDKDYVTEMRLKLIHSYYLDTKNVLYIWHAVQICNERGCPDYPDWVRRYLGEAAKELLSFEKAGNKAPVLVKDSLKIFGRDFSEIHHSWRKDIVYDRIMEERRKFGRKRNVDIYADVGSEIGITGETAQRWYFEVKKWRNEILKDGS